MITQLVKESIEREKLIEKNDKILVALSGGADSLCLLDILIRLKEEYNLTLYAAHLDHMIRGADAVRDALYCYDFCKKNDVTFFLKAVDVVKKAKEEFRGVEETARSERYNMLLEIKQRLNIDKIAVAHNLDDQAETILMKLMRGSGLQGLRGMDYKRDDIIRPLLDIYKKNINKYCEENCLEPRIDKTNFEDKYTRNKIRLELIPYIEKRYSANIMKILSRTANIIRDDHNYIEKVAKENYDLLKDIKSKDELSIDIKLLENIDIAIKTRIIRLAIYDLIGTMNNIENVHIKDILSLVKKSDGKMIHLPKYLKVFKQGDKLIFTIKELVDEEYVYGYKLNINGYTRVDEIGLTVKTTVLKKEESMQLPTSKYIKVFDFDKVKGDMVIRSRKVGDKIKPIGFDGSKKIKEALIEMKIPNNEKHLFPVICNDVVVMCLFGYRISDDYKIDAKTQNVLRVEFEYDEDRRNIVEKY